jgi:hypothetical protein
LIGFLPRVGRGRERERPRRLEVPSTRRHIMVRVSERGRLRFVAVFGPGALPVLALDTS